MPGTAPGTPAVVAAAKLKARVVSAEKIERLFVEHKVVKVEAGHTFLGVTMELEATTFQEMTFGAETKKACVVDLASLYVTDGKRQSPMFREGKDEDNLSKEAKKLMYIYDSEPKITWLFVFAVLADASGGLQIKSSQFDPIPLTVK
jgi:hypothetical protein